LLGPYEILAQLGAGGMGEVYRAKDTRLGRTVAIKVLPSHLSSSLDLRQRFEREARAVSSLNHPHICTLHDIGHQDEIDYLVMEYIEGQTLSSRLQKGPLPTTELFQYAIQIANALDKAHKQGIVHRDLKPGNIMITKSGIKLLDFGLAKLQKEIPNVKEVSSFPTEQHELTKEGMILGTVPYMAPEQLEGKDADARTDIFAFGCVLYEMVTGKRAFTGNSQASLITAIMSSEPTPVSQHQPMSPPALDRVISTCLAKDPDERWQNAHDLMGELKWISEGGSHATIAKHSKKSRKSREWIAWALVAMALLLAAVTFLRNQKQPAIFNGPVRSSILLNEKSALRAAVISPDGTRFVFVARDSSGKSSLWIRSLNSFILKPLPNTDNPSFPFWSPDSRFIGFFADGKLKKIDASGGPPQTLCDAPIGRGGTWNRNGVILFCPVVDGPLYRVSASGGVPSAVTQFNPQRGETSHRWPYFLPDGKHYLYDVASFGGEKEKTGIYLKSLDSKDEKLLVRADSNVAYAPPGYILFFRERNLMVQPFDLKSGQTTGDPFLAAEEIEHFPQTYYTLFSVSENGVLLHGPRSTSAVSQLIWFDRAGKQISSLGTPSNQANPKISPDGKKVAVDITDPQTGNVDVWIYESSGGFATRFTSHSAIDAIPVWSPDGNRVVFQSLRKGHADLYQKLSSGLGNEELILESPRTKYETDFSPNGEFIMFRALDPKSKMELWLLPTGGDRTPSPFIKTSYGVSHGQFSPDGRLVSYASNESGRWEIYVASFPGPGGNWKISSGGGFEPRWRRDGKELYYLHPDGKMMAVNIMDNNGFEASPSRTLFQTRRREQISSTDLFTYDVSNDGQRFLVNTDVGETNSSVLSLVLNWDAEYKK
jgi:serine/threonine protein kinase/dipeptidyl aminopeptidase/acylaminoacyl peptidase